MHHFFALDQPTILQEEAIALEHFRAYGVPEELDGVATSATHPFARICWREHSHDETFWLLFIICTGFPVLSDNGHMVISWPKALFPASAMSDAIALYQKNFGMLVVKNVRF